MINDSCEGIRNVADVLRSETVSIYNLGRNCSIAKCRAMYDVEALKRLPRSNQNALIKEHYPKADILNFYKVWILDFISKVNVKTSLTGAQVDFLAERFFHTYSWTEKDLYLFFRNIKSGIYGPFFENLSPEKILDWAEIYWSDRAVVADMIHSSSSEFNINKDKINPKVFAEMFKDVKEPEKTPKVMEKKTDTFMDSEKAFRAYLANIVGMADKAQLISLIEAWRIIGSQRQYVDIFIVKLLEVDKRAKGYCDAVNKIIELEDKYRYSPMPEYLEQIEELNNKILEYVPN